MIFILSTLERIQIDDMISDGALPGESTTAGLIKFYSQ